ncbi:hypothetical protein BU17DRAFT_51113 [Hysterangium stoloniferum]|nr:hypothetical protein BU17DRAFT_51113 [Hysterangium stoloniferum]
MPKSSKKKKEKNVDFSKARLKLGKGKQVANNATDTSFKARSIAVPHQTIGQTKDISKPTTRRNLTLDDLLVQLKHYNPGTRKDAILGLRELLEAHPALVHSSLTPIIQTCARIISDEDVEVRKTLLTFFDWFLHAAPLHQIRPHTPLLILFITSAQTNIFPAIRIDAVRFLDLLLELTPELIVQNWKEHASTGNRVLEGYLGLLNAGSSYWIGHKDDGPTPSASSVTLSPNSKLIVVSSLASFLQNAISPLVSQDEATIPTWFMTSMFPTHAEYLGFCSLTNSLHLQNPVAEVEWSERLCDSQTEFLGQFNTTCFAVDGNPGFSLTELGEVGQAINALSGSGEDHSLSNSTSNSESTPRTLNPIIVSIWLDVAPMLFGVARGTTLPEVEAQLALSVTRIAGCLYGAIFRETELPTDIASTAFDDLSAFLSYMSPYLPAVAETSDIQSEDFTRDLSFQYCELTSLAFSASHGDKRKVVKSSKAKHINALVTQMDRVAEFVVKALDGQVCLKSVANPLGYPLTTSAYKSLLPTIWTLLTYQNVTDSKSLSSTIRLSCIQHALRISSRSGIKAAATQFIGILVLLQSQRGGSIATTSELMEHEIQGYREWYQHLPKVLWEIGGADPMLTEIISRLILRISQRRIAMFETTTIAAVCSRMTPYFSVTRSQKGELLGPFTKLKEWPRIRRLVLDAAAVLISEGEPSVTDTMRRAVGHATKATGDIQYWSTLI